MAALQYSSFAINFGVQFILSFIIPPAVFGEYTKLQTTADVLLIFMAVGFHSAIFRNFEESQEEVIRHTFWLSMFQNIFVALVGATVLGIGYYLDFFSIKTAIITEILLIIGALTVTKQVIYTVYETKKNFILNSKINFFISLGIGIITIVIAFYFPSTELLLLKGIIGGVMMLSVYAYLAVFQLNINLSYKKLDNVLLKNILHFSFRIYLARLMETLQGKIDLLIAAYLFSFQELGIYERVRYYATITPTLLGSLTTRLSAVAHHTKDNLNNLYYAHASVLILAPILYLFSFVMLYAIGVIFQVVILIKLLPLYFCFWHFAGFGLVLENIRLYAQIHHSVFRTSFKIRFIPLIFFCLLLFILQAIQIEISIFSFALILASSYLSAFIFLSPKLFIFPFLRFAKLVINSICRNIK